MMTWLQNFSWLGKYSSSIPAYRTRSWNVQSFMPAIINQPSNESGMLNIRFLVSILFKLFFTFNWIRWPDEQDDRQSIKAMFCWKSNEVFKPNDFDRTGNQGFRLE